MMPQHNKIAAARILLSSVVLTPPKFTSFRLAFCLLLFLTFFMTSAAKQACAQSPGLFDEGGALSVPKTAALVIAYAAETQGELLPCPG